MNEGANATYVYDWLITRLNSSLHCNFWKSTGDPVMWIGDSEWFTIICYEQLPTWVQPAKSISLTENQEHKGYRVSGNDNSGVKACCWQRFSIWNRWLYVPSVLWSEVEGWGGGWQGFACNIRFIVSAPTPFSTCPKRQINPILLSPSVHRHDTSVSAIIHCLTCFWDTSHATLTRRMWLLHRTT